MTLTTVQMFEKDIKIETELEQLEIIEDIT